MSKGKIGIFLPGQAGDIMYGMCVLKYRDTLWPDKDIIWLSTRYLDLFKFNDKIDEVRPWPDGWQLPERCKEENAKLKPGETLWEDLSPIINDNNRIKQDLKHTFHCAKDLEEGYFPAPWMMSVEKRDGIHYPNIARKVFGININWEWHPYLCFSNEEKEMVKDFCLSLPHKKTVMLETFMGSSPTRWTDDMTRQAMQMCRNRMGPCNFIFASHEDNSRFFDDIGVVSCKHFTVRQTALVNNYSDLMIGIGSGISVATSCWGNKPTPKFQYTGSYIGSTVGVANGPYELVEYDFLKNPKQEFAHRLVAFLHRTF